MENGNIKQPAEALNLTATIPNIIRYDRDLIRKVVFGVVLIVIISIFWVMSKKNNEEIKEEEQVNFEHINPKFYDKSKRDPSANSNIAIAQKNEISSQNRNSYYYRSQDSLTKDPTKVGEHNVSLLREYFEQQTLIKIKEEDDARIAPIAFSMPTTAVVSKSSQNVNVNSLADLNNNIDGSNLNNIGATQLLKAGSIIPCVLSTAINSDLPGVVVARVREHVFDTASGKFLLIPQGSMLIGRYNNEVNFGQERVQIVFERLDLPPTNKHPGGFTVQLEQLASSDLSGHSGISDRVNNHYYKVAVGVSLSSLLAAVGVGKDELYELRDRSIYKQRAINKASENVSEIANKIADKQIKQNPTITIRAGVPFNIIVAKDLSLLPI